MPVLSFFSKQLYVDVARNWKGANLGYLFLLLAVCCVPMTIHLCEQMRQSDGEMVLNQIPDIQIQAGHVSIQERQPYYIRRSDGWPLAIIDTTGSMNYIDDPTVKAMLTESKLIIRVGRRQFSTIDLSAIENLYINKQTLLDLYHMAHTSLSVATYGILLMVSFFAVLIFLLPTSVAGVMVSSVMSKNLRLKDVLRMSTVAVTPTIILITISTWIDFYVPGIIFLGVTLLYLLFGIMSCQEMVPGTREEQIDLKSFLRDNQGLDEAA